MQEWQCRKIDSVIDFQPITQAFHLFPRNVPVGRQFSQKLDQLPANDSFTMCLRKRDVSPLFSGAHSLTEPFRSGCFPVRLW